MASSEYDLVKWKADNRLHPQTANEAAVDWIFLVDSLNFSFWPDAGQEFTIDGQVGYWALAAAVNRAQGEDIPLTDPAFYSKLTLEQAGHIFRTDQAGITIPMLKERVEVLNTNGKVLLEVSNWLILFLQTLICIFKPEIRWHLCQVHSRGSGQCHSTP